MKANSASLKVVNSWPKAVLSTTSKNSEVFEGLSKEGNWQFIRQFFLSASPLTLLLRHKLQEKLPSTHSPTITYN